MSFPMVRCEICDKDVSKRSTVDLSIVGMKGRGCRTHPNVSDAIIDRDMKVVMRFVKTELERKQEVEAVAAGIRALTDLGQVSMDRAIEIMRKIGVPEPIVSDARNKAEAMRPELCDEDARQVFAAAIALSFL